MPKDTSTIKRLALYRKNYDYLLEKYSSDCPQDEGDCECGETHLSKPIEVIVKEAKFATTTYDVPLQRIHRQQARKYYLSLPPAVRKEMREFKRGLAQAILLGDSTTKRMRTTGGITNFLGVSP